MLYYKKTTAKKKTTVSLNYLNHNFIHKYNIMPYLQALSVHA